MTFRSTSIFLADDHSIIQIRVYTTDVALPKGLWNIDTNEILLTMPMYEEFWANKRKPVEYQRNFFDGLEKVSHFALPPSQQKGNSNLL